jgi:pimeloyl-ACP methyl ester carboxylesterase
MNQYYTYPHIELWQDDKWKDRLCSIDWLIQKIQGEDNIPAGKKYGFPETSNPKLLQGYAAKANSVDIPETVEYWKSKGFLFKSLEQGRKHWISMVPVTAYNENSEKYRVLITLHRMRFDDPWWAMKTLEDYRSRNEAFAQERDTILLYLISDGPDTDRIYGNILQEACVLYPADLEAVYLDVSPLIQKGQRLSAINGCNYRKNGGAHANPDECIEKIGGSGIEALNISGLWGSRDSLSRCLVMNHKMNEGLFDRDALAHSLTGKEMMESILLEYLYDDIYQQDYKKYWDEMGLIFDIHETKGRRWTSMIPKCARENPEKKLPLVLIMQEVYRGNEHLALTANSYFYRYCQIAAQGECILLYFALEDPDSNDLLVDIAEEAFSLYPCDRRRVYVTGHSHDSWFARHFAYRHPGMIAALGMLGFPFVMQPPEETGNPTESVDDEQLKAMEKIDMPTVIVNGLTEIAAAIPDELNARTRWAVNLQRRLKSLCCRIPEIEEIMAARNSANRAIRSLGVPGTNGETFYSGGFEHYIVDIQNKRGENRFRIAASENMPHTVTPVMVDISFSFMRRFARDQTTGKIIEL